MSKKQVFAAANVNLSASWVSTEPFHVTRGSSCLTLNALRTLVLVHYLHQHLSRFFQHPQSLLQKWNLHIRVRPQNPRQCLLVQCGQVRGVRQVYAFLQIKTGSNFSEKKRCKSKKLFSRVRQFSRNMLQCESTDRTSPSRAACAQKEFYTTCP